MRSPSVQNYYSVLRSHRQIIKQHVGHCVIVWYNVLSLCVSLSPPLPPPLFPLPLSLSPSLLLRIERVTEPFNC